MKSTIQFIIAMLIFSTLGLVTKLIPMSGFGITFIRSFVGLLFFIIYKLVLKKKTDFTAIKKNLKRMLVSSILMSISWVLLFTAYDEIAVSKTTVIYYLAPIFLLIYGLIIEHEDKIIKKIIVILCATIGLVLIIGFNDLSIKDIKGICYALGAAITYAAFVIVNKKVMVNSADKNTIQFLICSIIMLPLFIIKKDYNIEYNVITTLSILCIGIIHTGIAYLLYLSSMNNLKSSEISILSYIDPVGSFLLSILLLKEPLTALSLIGSILILISLLIYDITERIDFITLLKRKNKQDEMELDEEKPIVELIEKKSIYFLKKIITSYEK